MKTQINLLPDEYTIVLDVSSMLMWLAIVLFGLLSFTVCLKGYDWSLDSKLSKIDDRAPELVATKLEVENLEKKLIQLKQTKILVKQLKQVSFSESMEAIEKASGHNVKLNNYAVEGQNVFVNGYTSEAKHLTAMLLKLKKQPWIIKDIQIVPAGEGIGFKIGKPKDK